MRRPPLFAGLVICVFTIYTGLASFPVHADDETLESRVAVSGRVVDEEGKPVAGVAVHGIAYSDKAKASTDADGQFVLNLLRSRASSVSIVADDSEHDRMGLYKPSAQNPITAETPIEIALAPSRRFKVAVVDAAGEPAAGATVGALVDYAPLASVTTDDSGEAVLRVPTAAELQVLYAVAPGEGFDYRMVQTVRDKAHRAPWLDDPTIRFQFASPQSVRIKLVDGEQQPIANVPVHLWLLYKPGEPDSFNLSFTPELYRSTTDETGVAEFHGIPDWNVYPLTFWPATNKYVRQRITFDPKENTGGELAVALNRLVPVTGHVALPDGNPAEGADVEATGTGYDMDGHRSVTKTDSDGQFTLEVAPNQLYMFLAGKERLVSAAVDGIIVRPDEPVTGLEFELRPAARIHGRVVVGEAKRPVAGQQMMLRQPGRDLDQLGAELPNPEDSRRNIQPAVYRWTNTDDDGHFEFFVGPGTFTLSGPSQAETQKFEVTDEQDLEFNFHIPRPETGPFAGMVVTGDPPRPVANAIVEGKYRSSRARSDLRLRADENGRFSGERALHRTVLYAKSPEGDLRGIVEIEPDQAEATIAIAPVASARGRLLDEATNEPLPGTEVRWGRRVHKGADDAPWETAWGGTVVTDADAYFELSGMVVGQTYELSVPRGDGSYGGLPGVTPTVPEVIELGDLKLKPPYEPPTLEERIAGALAHDKLPIERYEHALAEADRLLQHVLVIFVARDAHLTEQWFKLRFEDGAVRAALPNYQVLAVDTEADGVSDLAEQLGISLEPNKLPAWYLGNTSGKPLVSGSMPQSEKANGLDRPAIVELLSRHVPEPLDAHELLREALVEAATSNRRVIVQETATWCGPCHMVTRYLEKQRSIWKKDYLWVQIDHRWHGSYEVMNSLKEGYRGGIPWLAVLDSDRTVLATSEGPDGNIGFPHDSASIDHFMSMISSTRLRLSDEDLKALRADLETSE